MDIPILTVARPILNKLVALQSFFLSRPRIDVDIVNDPASLYGQKSLGYSSIQDHLSPIPLPYVKHDFEFYWNYKLRIKNNSSKTAYNIKLERIYKTPNDYVGKIDEIASLKEGEIIEIDYKLKYYDSKSNNEAQDFLNQFPGHLEKIEILVSYTNEARFKFYTRFVATSTLKTNEHLLLKPEYLTDKKS